ncbi:flagellar associated protein [Monoraphidium neglectum]|uniref:Flagellar associated protein n=1 Tax=Monoraphidium neglectum TaxID=145388 RepID=A0A0D2N742_9CHLO|nr:flagellar associated protein [Monoraphidium neglectum]KIZ01656.1 flagellar associated protein [Monoraphidium neglectum]|eukprot:XP_013900675.1 flagellar associated protein [Monoraphidium neglectum]
MATDRLDLLNAEGEGTIYYPSGRIALTVCKSPDGFFHTFTADSQRFQVLANFDSDGIGGANHPDGRPWLVVTRDGWSLSSPEGRKLQGGKWPRPAGAREAISLQLAPHLSVDFVDRQNIRAHLKLQGIERTFQCGEFSRRQGQGSYLDKVVRTLPGGKLELDMGPIRRRIEEVGSVYVSRGPHHLVTAQPGLGNLKSMLASVRAGSPITAMVAQLDATQGRIRRINTKPISAYGGAHAAKHRAEPLADFGSPPLSKGQLRLADGMKRAQSARPSFDLRRRKLPLISVTDLDEHVAGPGAPKDTLFCACVLADWNPVCARLDNQHLQAAWYELSEAAAADANCPAARVRLVRVDGSESRVLQARHGFRTAPMFLFYYQGSLVDAGNDVRSKEEMIERALAALALGRRGEVLPQGFSFQGSDNRVLDKINRDMSLLTGSC